MSVRKAGDLTDFEFWAKHEYWRYDEGLFLLLGYDPRDVNFTNRDFARREPAFIRGRREIDWKPAYNDLSSLLETSRPLDSLDFARPRLAADFVRPQSLVSWATLKRIPVPKELSVALKAHGIGFRDLLSQIERLTAENDALRERVVELEAENDALHTWVADSEVTAPANSGSPPKAVRGRTRGAGSLAPDDAPLVMRGVEMLKSREVTSAQAAAKALSAEARGHGTLDSKERRLAVQIRRARSEIER